MGAYVLNKDVVIKKKESVDIVIAYDVPTAGACVVEDDVLIKAKLEAADTTMDIVEVTASTLDGTKCRTTYVTKKKAGKTAATMLDLKGVIADKYTAITSTDRRRLNGRRLPTGMDSSADQSTEIDSQEQPKPKTDDPAAEPAAPTPSKNIDGSGGGESSNAVTSMVSTSLMA